LHFKKKLTFLSDLQIYNPNLIFQRLELNFFFDDFEVDLVSESFAIPLQEGFPVLQSMKRLMTGFGVCFFEDFLVKLYFFSQLYVFFLP
jgi:hypothetical protein